MKEVRFTPSLEDLTTARRLYYRSAQRLLVKWAFLVGVGVPLISWAFGDPPSIWDFVTYQIVAFGMLALFYPISFYLFAPYMARQSFRFQKALHREVSVRWDQSNISFESDRGCITDPLSDIACWVANDQTLLIFRGMSMYQFLPTRAFPDAGVRQSLIVSLTNAGVRQGWPPK